MGSHVGHCAFCQKYGKLTGEHRWSNWLNKLFGEKEKYTIERRHPTLGTIRSRMIGLNDKAPCVCGQCNSGWMHEIEDRVKPFLGPLAKDGVSLSFLPSGIAVLATFVFEKAVVSDNGDSKGRSFFSVPERVAFMRRLEIPDGIQMWIASCHADFFEGIYQSYIFDVRQKNARFFSFTWTAGNIALQMLAGKWKGTRAGRKSKFLPWIIPNPKWDAVSMRFWPNDGSSITWNPASDLGTDSLKVFRDRFSDPINFVAPQV